MTTQTLPSLEDNADDPIAINVEEMTGNLTRRAAGIPRNATIEDLIASLSHALHMPDTDAQGHPILYGLRTADGDPLNPTDRVREVLQQDDTVTITKSVTAG
jgi:hypothetical protein